MHHMRSNVKFDKDGMPLDRKNIEFKLLPVSQKQHTNDFNLNNTVITVPIYCGGANNNNDEFINGTIAINYAGLMLTNPRNNCFIHAAVNAIVTNSHLMEEIDKPHPFDKWYTEILHQHKPALNVESIPPGEDDILVQIRNFFLSGGCTQLPEHGEVCSNRIKKQYDDHLWYPIILDQIKKLITSHTKPLYVTSLKAILYIVYPSNISYGCDDQDDAGIPFWHIIECLPSWKEMFTIKARKRYQCLACKNTDGSTPASWCVDNKFYCDLEYSGKIETLDTKIKQWAYKKRTINKRCRCLFHKMRNNDEETVPDTVHEETFEVLNAPKLLYIKVRDFSSIERVVNVTESFTMKGKNYTLLSCMLYTGAGTSGHWRCLVKERQGFMLYNDDITPYLVHENNLNDILRKGINFIYVADKSTDEPIHASHSTELSSQQRTSAIHEGNKTTPITGPKPSTSGMCSLTAKGISHILDPILKPIPTDGFKIPTYTKKKRKDIYSKMDSPTKKHIFQIMLLKFLMMKKI